MGLGATRLLPAVLRAGAWQVDEERGSSIRRTLCPDATSMTLEDSVNGRQPEASARELAFGMEPLERSEKAVGVFHVEAGTIVTYLQHGTPIDRRGRQLD